MISVCLPTYNGSKYILEQINSILIQLTEEDEIIVSDDCSTDNTLQLLRGLNDPRIKIFENPKFSSYVFNFENALMRAGGDIIFLSDQDDVWLPNKTKVMCDALNNFDLVLSDCYVVNLDLNIIHDSYFKIRKTVKNKFFSLIGRSPYLGCCLAFNRKVLSKALPFPKSVNSHDIWIGNIAAFFYKIVIIDEKLLYYRRHNENTSIMAGSSRISNVARIIDRGKMIFQLLSRI